MGEDNTDDSFRETFHELMRRGERHDWGWLLSGLAAAIASMALPLFLVTVPTAHLPVPEPLKRSKPEIQLDTALAQSEEALAIAVVDASPQNDDGAWNRRTRLQALQQNAVQKRRQTQATEHTRYQTDVRALTGIGILTLFGFFTYFAQVRVLRRGWRAAFGDRVREKRPFVLWLVDTVGLLELGFFAAVISMIVYWVPQLSIPGENGPSALSRFAKPELFILILNLALFVVAVAVTAFATWTYARNYPWVSVVERRLAKLVPRETRLQDIWPALRKIAPNDRPLNMNPELSPHAISKVISTLTTPLAVWAVLGVVVMNLGFDRLEVEAFDPKSLSATHDAWLTFVGAVLTVTLCAVYIIPMIQIGPFIPAWDDAKALLADKDPATWHGTIVSKASAHDFVLTEGPKPKSPPAIDGDAEDPQRIDRILARHLGANETKLVAILIGPKYGATYQLIVGDTLRSKLVGILTLLAPTLAGTFLSVLN